MAMAFPANSMMATIIIGLIRLRGWQPPERIGTCWVWRDLPGFRSIETFQTEIESCKAAEELAEFLPGILAPVDDDAGRAVSFLDRPRERECASERDEKRFRRPAAPWRFPCIALGGVHNKRGTQDNHYKYVQRRLNRHQAASPRNVGVEVCRVTVDRQGAVLECVDGSGIG